MITEKTTWVCSDGYEFDTKARAEEHEIEMRLRSWATGVAKRSHPELAQEIIVDFVVSNRYQILSIMRGEDQA